MSSIFESKVNRVLITLVLVGIVVAVSAYAYITLKQAANWGVTTINVVGTGEYIATPDVAQFSFTVRAEGTDAATAQTASAEKINAMVSFLKEQAVAEKDIKTEGYNLVPKYKYEQKPCPVGNWCPAGEQIADGFEVFQTVTVKVREIVKSGEIISGVGEKGATDISGLTFTVGDENKAKNEARALAIADARAQAETLAKSLNVKLGKMTSYYEDAPGSPMYAGAMDMMTMKSEAAVAPVVPTGESKTVSTVNLTYEISQ